MYATDDGRELHHQQHVLDGLLGADPSLATRVTSAIYSPSRRVEGEFIFPADPDHPGGLYLLLMGRLTDDDKSTRFVASEAATFSIDPVNGKHVLCVSPDGEEVRGNCSGHFMISSQPDNSARIFCWSLPLTARPGAFDDLGEHLGMKLHRIEIIE